MCETGGDPGPGSLAGVQGGVTIKVGMSRMTMALHRTHEGKERIEAMRWAPTPARGHEMGPFVGEALRSLLTRTAGRGCPGALVPVVPGIRDPLSLEWESLTGFPLRLYSPLKAPFGIDYEPAEALGLDRSAAVWGALDRFGERLGNSFMVADFGTHTVTTVFHEGRILGGSIAPGIPLQRGEVGGGRVRLDGILQDDVRGKARFRGEEIGRSTAGSLDAGILLGTVLAVEGLKGRAENRLGRSIGLVVTGGLSCLLAPLLSSSFFHNRQLVHHGAWKFLSCP